MRHRHIGVVVLAALFSPLLQRSATDLMPRVEAAGAGMQAAGSAIARTRDGKPDFSGIWQAFTTANFDIQDHSAQPGEPAGVGIVEGNELPYLPEALAKKRENFANRATADRECVIPGMPRIMYMPFPFQIVQQPDELLILFEYDDQVRNLYLKDNQHPKGPIEWFMGDSRAHWDGDTLVVDVVYNDNVWLDRVGNFHSDALHMVERWTLIDRDHINYEATLDDPQVFLKPWKMHFVLYRRIEKNFKILDYLCPAFPLQKYYPYPEVSAAPGN